MVWDLEKPFQNETSGLVCAGNSKNSKYPPYGGGDSKRSKIIVLLSHGVGPGKTKSLVAHPHVSA